MVLFTRLKTQSNSQSNSQQSSTDCGRNNAMINRPSINQNFNDSDAVSQ